ncbi:hypothetical protein NHP190002_10580 [Helicobacter ailurogastricus]|nr:hypothetical protein ASB7_09760 [Helicobacter ailurogastricus]GMB90366.1 hypothetical protein NHP190002_10580 [Helicobacter ailurogastricus]
MIKSNICPMTNIDFALGTRESLDYIINCPINLGINPLHAHTFKGSALDSTQTTPNQSFEPM